MVKVGCSAFAHAGQRPRWRTRFSQNVLLPHVAGEGNADKWEEVREL